MFSAFIVGTLAIGTLATGTLTTRAIAVRPIRPDRVEEGSRLARR
jgi:hypothetical protein